MAELNNYTVDPQSIAKDITINVRYVGVQRFKARLWLALKIMRLAAWIAGFGLRYDGIEDYEEDSA